MLLRTSISKYKKFFQNTLNNFKSLFSRSYQKIPKTPPHNHSSYNDLEKFYSDFTEKWDSEKGKSKKRRKNKVMLSSSTTKQEEELHVHNHNENLVALNNAKEKNEMEKSEELDGEQCKQDSSSMFNSKSMVEKKLKELEMLEMSNVDYILDIEEVLHYYSRLTCPSYLEIVDKFFVEMYSEFFGCPETPASVNSKLKMRSVRS